MKKWLPTLLFVTASALFAQSGELWVNGGASVLVPRNIGSPDLTGDQSDIQLQNGFRFGFRYVWNTAGHYGHELQYAYSRTHLVDNTGEILGDVGKAGMAIHQAGWNLLYYFNETKEGAKVRPFVTAGLGFSDFVLPGSATQQGGSVRPAGNFGAGVKYKISPLFGLRFDVREYVSGKPSWGILHQQGSSALWQMEATVGFGIYF